MIMIKSKENTHFEMISASYLETYGDRILQIESEKLFDNSSSVPVFLCEVLNEKDEGQFANG